MRQKLLSLTDSFIIRNEAGDDVFTVRLKLLSIGKQLTFEDMEGNEVAFIRQKLISLRSTYEIYRGGKHFATVSKDLFTLFRHKFQIDVPGPDDLEAAGNFLDREYAFERAGRTVAQVSRRWFTITDTYGVDIEDGEDDALILASSVAIDMIAHGEND